MKATVCMSPSQLLLATHTQLSSQLLASINNATYVYIVRIHMFIYVYHIAVFGQLYGPKKDVPANSAALSRP